MPDGNTLGEVLAARIRHFRKQRGLSQEALADRLQNLGIEGFNQSMVAKVETDPSRAENLPVRRLLAFAMALNVSPIHLMTPDDPGDAVALDGGAEVYAGEVRQWVRGYWPLRNDDRREFFSSVPENEFEALVGQAATRNVGKGLPAPEFYVTEGLPKEA